jgi:hypothetical protein
VKLGGFQNPVIQRGYNFKIGSLLRLFQNLVGFETTSWKSGQMPAFPLKSKVAVPKTEVLEQPLLYPPFPELYNSPS